MKPHKYGFFLQRDQHGFLVPNRDCRRLLERCYKIRQHGWHRKFLPDEQKTIYVKNALKLTSRDDKGMIRK